MKKKIAWISQTFVETDIYIVRLLCRTYDIEWHVLTQRGKSNEFERELHEMQSLSGLRIVRESVYRRRDPRSLRDFFNIFKSVKKGKPDYVYAGECGYPHALPLIKMLLGVSKVVVPVHNVKTPKGAVNYRFAKWNTGQILATYKNFQTFSKSQQELLRTLKPSKMVFYTPFLLKDYGAPSTTPSDVITFLSFGWIRRYKRIDVLINAAQAAYEQVGKRFVVEIAGNCEDWDSYCQLIRYPELFRTTIRRIKNEEIPDIFGRCHYFVTPYQDIAQSGSAIVGINYDKPLIASDLEAFREYVVDGADGFLMRPASVEDLTAIMVRILNDHEKIYTRLVEGVRKIKEEKFSPTAVVKAYTDMFENLI